MLEGKDLPSRNLISKGAFAEMIEWEKIFYGLSLPENHGMNVTNASSSPFGSLSATPASTNSTNSTMRPDGTPWRNLKFADICKQFNFTKFDENDKEEYIPPPACSSSQKPLDFIFVKQDNSYHLSDYATDAHLLHKVRTGKGDPKIFYGFNSMFINLIFAGTYP